MNPFYQMYSSVMPYGLYMAIGILLGLFAFWAAEKYVRKDCGQAEPFMVSCGCGLMSALIVYFSWGLLVIIPAVLSVLWAFAYGYRWVLRKVQR